MSRREKFSYPVKEEAKQRVNYTCERCGRSNGRVKQLEVHHRLAIWFAKKYFPQLSSIILNSIANAEVLCYRCHLKLHKRDRSLDQKRKYRAVGRELTEKQRELFSKTT